MSTGIRIAEERPDPRRLLAALSHQPADRIPRLEFWVTSAAVYEYVLGRPIAATGFDGVGEPPLTPQEKVEFALRTGMDAVVCHLSWRPNNIFRRDSDGHQHYVDGSLKSRADLDRIDPPPSLDSQLRKFEQYVEAADAAGLGVIPNFTSFFSSTMLATGMEHFMYLLADDRPFLEDLMDRFVETQGGLMRAVCRRFPPAIPFVLVNDDVAYNSGLIVHPGLFRALFTERMRTMIAPARECGKPTALHCDGRTGPLIPLLREIGFSLVQPNQPESNDLFALHEEWKGRFAFMGNIPTSLLMEGSPEQIEEIVRRYCERMGTGGGWILGSSSSIMDGIPPENFAAMMRAADRYGRSAADARADGCTP
jgi:hypothetical protein